MSTVKSKKLQVGTDASASNNFTIYQPATPDGTLRIGVGNADSPTEVGQFNANGYKPQAPVSIVVHASSAQSISNVTGTKVQYDTVAFYTGSASNYNTSTYTYTVPYNGLYLVNHTIELRDGPNVLHSGIYLNGGSSVSKGHKDAWQQHGNIINSTSEKHSNAHIKLLHLSANDTLEFYTYHSSGAAKAVEPNRCSFSVVLLHQT